MKTICPLLYLFVLPVAVIAANRPNILFIMSDDHCTRGVGAYGERLAELNPTPYLDRLAEHGMLFNQVFCANSICTPSRATIMTGQYSHRNGVYDLYDGLPGRQHDLPRLMKEAGYATAVIGKWHLRDSPSFFDYYAVIAGQGRYLNPSLHTSAGGALRKVRYDSTLVKEVAMRDFQGHSSDVLTDLSLEWLKEGRDPSKPFFLMHHFKAPHDWFVYAERYKNYLEDAHIPEPDNLYDQPGPKFGSVATRGPDDRLVGVIGSTVSRHATKRNLTSHYHKQILARTERNDLSPREMTHHTYQLYLKEYLRCIKGIDDNLQRLLDYLDDSGLAEHTVVIYTSDQGMMLGEHDYIDKRWIYEESIRMPLIISSPKRVAAGTRCDWLINNTDFAPTLLDLAGIPVPITMQGLSFSGALQGAGQPAHWRTSTYYRYWMHMAHGHNNPAHFGIRTHTDKLIFFYGTDYKNLHRDQPVKKFGGNRFWADTPPAWEYYDLKNDPTEMHNRYGDPAYHDRIEQRKAELRQVRKEIGDTDEDYPKIRGIVETHWGS